MTWPRLQFSVGKLMIAVAGVAGALAYAGTGTTKLGCGSAQVLLTFQVVDDQVGRPVPGASIELIEDYSAPPTASVITGNDGSAQVGCKVGATWYQGPYFRTYRCLHFGQAVRIEAPGYQPIDTILQWLPCMRNPAYHNSPTTPPIPVRLQRTGTTGVR